MGIFNFGSNDLTITGQAIGVGASVTTGNDAGSGRARDTRDRTCDGRDRTGDSADSGHDHVSNIGTGRVTITNSSVGGRFIRNRTL
ncbi:MAG: hypothetical protein J2P25_22670 [Nocardiopsaceae bacterium]|nr:hypothetical protein [Nocardiopsaceae bacterium]